MEVRRKENELAFETVQVSDVDCDGYMNVRIEIQNTGEEEEQDVELRVIDDDLGTLWSDTFDVYSINDDDEYSSYRKTLNLDLKGLSPGTHTLQVQALYDNAVKSLEKNIQFNVRECGAVTSVGVAAQDTTDRATERYYNPNRDTSALFGSGEVEVVVDLPPADAHVPSPPSVPATKESGFGTFVLVIANIAIIVFIVLLLRSIYE
jgi:hypothetical protein